MKTRILKYFRPILLLIGLIVFCSHNLYIKLETYFLKPNKEATLSLYNGTFENSENIIARDRMLDASLVFNGQRLNIDQSQWTDKDSTVTKFKFTPIEPGTYVAGVSTKARNIELTANKFNNYLKHDGVLDVLDQRTKDNILDQDAVESYQKHVKAIYQVGDVKTNDWQTVLGYPIEFVPQENPYNKFTGDKLNVKLLVDGKPQPNQLVYVDYLKIEHDHYHDHNHHGHEHSHEHQHNDKEHKHTHAKDQPSHDHGNAKQLRTNENGIIEVNFTEDGIYYLRTIHMENVTDNDALTHRSKWATLTFEVTHSHDDSAHSHNHDHNHEHDHHIPTWVFIAGSLLIIGVLFFIFRKKS